MVTALVILLALNVGVLLANLVLWRLNRRSDREFSELLADEAVQFVDLDDLLRSWGVQSAPELSKAEDVNLPALKYRPCLWQTGWETKAH